MTDSHQKETVQQHEKRKAVALRYKRGEDAAPKVAAKGEGAIAEKIIALAKEHGVAMHEDPDLVNILARFDLQEEIPEELYQVVAEILVFVYKMNKKEIDEQ